MSQQKKLDPDVDFELVPYEPPIVWEMNRVYSRDELLKYWRIAKDTLADWQRDGLPVLCRNQKEYRYLGADVVNFLRSTVAPESHQIRGATKKRRNTDRN